ncbi:GNAT family N-acetyltransferase [Telluribacter sp. SYSU D00476]|uniref:GNAT family N-acetyltransferase n=1 Tax=Telluribacter sp. SYSU D00476 TaxID=2811430 RepID=UPI001FF56DEE|nr:GNAT family N-acetyltransferase [Telluribacter sp. SYSU D00476]
MKNTLHHQIEKANSTDYDEIVEVWEASVRATHDFLSEKDIQYFRPLIRSEYLKTVDLFCIRSEQGRIEGFLGTSEDKIEMLFLRPEARGKGIGKALLQYAIHNLTITKVDVNEQNGQAVGFYEHLGFRVVSRSELDGTGKPYPILGMQLAGY